MRVPLMPKSELPSWTNSTLSQIAMMAASAYIIVASKIAWLTGDIAPLKWAAEMFAASYLSSRGLKGVNGNVGELKGEEKKS